MTVLHLATRAGRFLLTRLGLRLRVRGSFLGEIRCPGLTDRARHRAVADRTALRAIGDRAPHRALDLADCPRGLAYRTPHRSIRLFCR